ncbi:uncharacterized protein TNCT_294931 [Trichonephila clavata]|uniref:Uncharacterized protein n=1 Tax=Trichonephila clavata TaxID=2740835 RepID=A0A8X6H2X8_TRICU|nr:uncharacterized protein TNCT_294931 [Trichonephila clavata]
MMAPEPRYGFMYLKRTGSTNGYMVHCFTDSLYENMMSYIQAANAHPMDTVESDCRMKVAYFKVLNNNRYCQRTPQQSFHELSTSI